MLEVTLPRPYRALKITQTSAITWKKYTLPFIKYIYIHVERVYSFVPDMLMEARTFVCANSLHCRGTLKTE